MSKPNRDDFDPYYVKIRRQEAAIILGVSTTEFDRLRRTDDKFPEGRKYGSARNSPVLFRLSEIYAYGETLWTYGKTDKAA